MRWSISICLCALAASLAQAGPVDFGLAECNAAIASRNLKWKVKYEVTLDPPETYRIEPYKNGGAHVTGGDLRGLMYGLLELADQIRSTGRMKQDHGAPATAIRGVRMFVRTTDLEFDWKRYFETLARDRFNRFALIFLDSPYPAEQKLAAISQLAADYGIDFTLGIWEHEPSAPSPQIHDALRKFLSACPLIRTIEMRSDSQNVEFYRSSIFKALHEAGRRVALAPSGSLAEPPFMNAAAESGVAIRLEPASWPPGFEIDAPREFETHQFFYWVWGRLGYDSKTKPQHGENPKDLATAAQILVQLSAARAADPNTYILPESNPNANPGTSFSPIKAAAPNPWIASIPESVSNRLNRVASAKYTPLDTADKLLTAAAALDQTAIPDLQLLIRLARYHAHKQRAAYFFELFHQAKDSAFVDRAAKELKDATQYFNLADTQQLLDLIASPRGNTAALSSAQEIPPVPKPLARPQFASALVNTAVPDQPLNLTLQIASIKDASLKDVTVRLHYRPTDQPGPDKIIEKPVAQSVVFTIPPADLPPFSGLLYFFEILNRENGGWFEPDPATSTPYHIVRIEPK